MILRFLNLILLVHLTTGGASALQTDPAEIYDQRRASRDGTGRYFMGREIAKYMTYHGASWLWRSTREREERPSRLLDVLDLKPGDVIADIGAGAGYLSFPMADRVSPGGWVYAVDIQPEMLAMIESEKNARKVNNIRLVLGDPQSPRLPDKSIDVAVLLDVYHELYYPYEMMQEICRAMKPGGRVVLVEYRGEDPSVPIKPLHKMTQRQVKKEMKPHPLRWVRTSKDLPRQHIFIFQKYSAVASQQGSRSELRR
jgi:ubiquinone/menaquinone biosynthesis C-methylase UbiE